MQFSGNQVLKNAGSQVDKKIEDFGATFLELHKTFVDGVTTEDITALQILDSVGIISVRTSTQCHGDTHRKLVSSQAFDAGTQS